MDTPSTSEAARHGAGREGEQGDGEEGEGRWEEELGPALEIKVQRAGTNGEESDDSIFCCKERLDPRDQLTFLPAGTKRVPTPAPSPSPLSTPVAVAANIKLHLWFLYLGLLVL